MDLKPVSREELQNLYLGEEAARKEEVKKIIQQIYDLVLVNATLVSTTSYTHQLSRYISTPQNNEDVIAGLKITFPDSLITFVTKINYEVIVIDWSPPQETELPEDESMPASPSEERSETKPSA